MLDQCYLGDWFLLIQLSKNTNLYFYRAFIKQLRNVMLQERLLHMNVHFTNLKNKFIHNEKWFNLVVTIQKGTSRAAEDQPDTAG